MLLRLTVNYAGLEFVWSGRLSNGFLLLQLLMLVTVSLFA